MHPPIFVRELSGAERAPLEASLRASNALTMRRAQIVLLSAAGRRPREIAQGLCCAVQTVRNGIRAFNTTGLVALSAGSSRPYTETAGFLHVWASRAICWGMWTRFSVAAHLGAEGLAGR